LQLDAPETGHLRDTVTGHEDVLRLEVAVDDVPLMHGSDALGSLEDQANGLGRLKLAAGLV
jgi:hypothetical protein